jgi:hypothetical protein
MKRFKTGWILPASACAALLLAVAGCEYDSPTPMYYQDHAARTGPSVTSLDPAQAEAGVNAITILGERFSAAPDSNRVYFSGSKAEILSATATAIVVRRPTVSGTLDVKVVNLGALETGSFDGYRVDAVAAPYGGFIDGTANSALCVDGSNNVYVFRGGLRTAFKVAADGTQSPFMTTMLRGVTDAVVGADGQIVLLANSMNLSKVNPADGTETEWIKATKKLIVGDADGHGNLYAAGKNSDLFVIHPDGTVSAALGVYASHDVKEIKVNGNHVYVVAEHANVEPKMAVFRHEILDAAGTLGPRELVLDRAAAGTAFAAAVFKDVMFSASGDMYVATNADSPIIQKKADGAVDVWYKGIVKGSAERLAQGTGRYAYMIQLVGTKGDLIRIDMGAAFGAPAVGMF